jgi:hypothetical protein
MSEPLGMPRGTVRAIIVIALTLAVIALCVMRMDIPGVLAAAFGAAIAHYYDTRKEETRGGETQ